MSYINKEYVLVCENEIKMNYCLKCNKPVDYGKPYFYIKAIPYNSYCDYNDENLEIFIICDRCCPKPFDSELLKCRYFMKMGYMYKIDIVHVKL